jgi:lipopolysaccharide transport system ATP-binding protein
MTSAPIISIESVSKAFPIYAKPSDVFKEALLGGKRHDLFWALRDISFSVHEKQRVGIIGPNGAGKSTLLQIVTGNLQPTTGTLHVDGRISALLSLVPAWSLEDSGIENIRFNLLLQGCSPSRIPAITEEIVDFTELGPFIQQPVRTYSSGMSARLSFAIATALEPDILIIDEVLATGDAYFIGKAYQRMLAFCDRGRAMLFVSHATDAIRRMCDSVIWLQNGSVRLAGPTEHVLRQYEEDFRRSEDEVTRSTHRGRSLERRNLVSLEDVLDEPLVRFRLLPATRGHFQHTHYVRSVRISGLGDGSGEVPLELADLARPETHAALDVLGSEWGRIYERRGSTCRALVRMTGRRAGGHLLAKPLARNADDSALVSLEFELLSPDGAEAIAAEALNVRTGTWDALPEASSESLQDGWRRVVAAGPIPIPRRDDVVRLQQLLALDDGPAVEIVEAFLLSPAGRTTAISEHEPFSIGVRVRATRTLPLADVSIKLMRSDGVYAFWQSSGMVGENIENLAGERVLHFRFDPNCFGAGRYLVSAYVANGWDLQRNYPYSEVYCRAIDALTFDISRAESQLDMGIVNVQARVKVS